MYQDFPTIPIQDVSLVCCLAANPEVMLKPASSCVTGYNQGDIL